jgi:hypothetical protein
VNKALSILASAVLYTKEWRCVPVLSNTCRHREKFYTIDLSILYDIYGITYHSLHRNLFGSVNITNIFLKIHDVSNSGIPISRLKKNIQICAIYSSCAIIETNKCLQSYGKQFVDIQNMRAAEIIINNYFFTIQYFTFKETASQAVLRIQIQTFLVGSGSGSLAQ